MKKIIRQRLGAFLLAMAMCTGFIAYSSPVAEASDSTQYVEGEVVALVDSMEEAVTLAELYGVELKSYAYGVAVLEEPEPVAVISGITIMGGADNLPTLYPNEVYYPLDVDYISADDEDVAAIYATTGYELDETDVDMLDSSATGEGVVVAIIDTGADCDHEYIKDSVDSSLSYNSYYKTYGNDAVEDDYGHGVHVAGIIAGAAKTKTSSYTISGVAPNATLMIIKADRPSDHGFEVASLSTAINYAVAKGADIINMSLGSAYNNGYYSEVMKTAVDAAEAAGVLVICAAGNESYEHAGYPAAFDSTIAVSATKYGYEFDDSYSNYGPEIDIAAPGTYLCSSYLEGDYVYMAGTSMATPVVTGIAALAMQANPDATAAEIRTLLTSTAKDAGEFGYDEYYGAGIVNAYAALNGEAYTATYVVDEETSYEVGFASGTILIQPADPTGTLDFGGWSEDKISETYFDFTTELDSDITLYAQWLKETQAAPSAPTVLTGYAEQTIVLNTIEGAEYGMNTSNKVPGTWQEDTTFEELEVNKTYYFFARMAETDENSASESSDVLIVTTTLTELEFTDGVSLDTITYGDAWSDVLDAIGYATTLAGTYTIAIDGVAIDNSDMPSVGEYTYEVLFNSNDKDYTNIHVAYCTVTVEAEEVGIEWGDTTVAYTGYEAAPTVTITSLVNEDDDVTAIVSGTGTDVGTDYTATVTGLYGEDADNYKLPTDDITTTYDIIMSNGVVYPDNTRLYVEYGETISEEVFIWAADEIDGDTSDTASAYTSDYGTMTFAIGETKLSEVQVTSSDVYEGVLVALLEYDTAEKIATIGGNTISATYSGNSNISETVNSEAIYLEISQLEITADMVENIAKQTYTGSAIEPTISIDGLYLDYDYTVTYTDNISTGTATATIEGIGYCTGTVNKTFTIAAASATTTGGSGGSTSSSSTEEEDETADVDVDTDDGTTTASFELEVEVDDNVASVVIGESAVEDAIAELLDEVDADDDAIVEISIVLDDDADTVETEISTDLLETIADSDITAISIKTDFGTITIPVETVAELIDLADDEDIVISIKQVADEDITAKLGDVKIVDLTITADGEEITSFNDEKIKIGIPFELEAWQTGGEVVVWYIDDDGETSLVDCEYDSDKGIAIFETLHFSCFAVGWEAVSYVYSNQFIDIVDGAYYYDAVLWAVKNEITSGTSDTTFSPDMTATRAQVVTLIWNAMGSPAPSAVDHAFTDLDESAYYYDAVLWAVENEITSGTSDTTFGPDEDCTRGQIVALLWNTANNPEVSAENAFEDVSDSAYYYSAILWAISKEITNGATDTTFEPESICTRAQIVTFLYRYFA